MYRLFLLAFIIIGMESCSKKNSGGQPVGNPNFNQRPVNQGINPGINFGQNNSARRQERQLRRADRREERSERGVRQPMFRCVVEYGRPDGEITRVESIVSYERTRKKKIEVHVKGISNGKCIGTRTFDNIRTDKWENIDQNNFNVYVNDRRDGHVIEVDTAQGIQILPFNSLKRGDTPDSVNPLECQRI
jgi:hypothetical protein